MAAVVSASRRAVAEYVAWAFHKSVCFRLRRGDDAFMFDTGSHPWTRKPRASPRFHRIFVALPCHFSLLLLQ
eukprot:2364-Alexandrium_andersonii.AAC.1